MVDARLRSDWLNKIGFMDLSDTAWRVFTNALMWAAGNGTDGEIPKRYLRWLHPSGEVKPNANAELSAAGLWEESDEAYQLAGWSTALGQSTAEQVEKYREDARIRQQRRRQRKKSAEAGPSDTPPHPSAERASITRDLRTNTPRDVRAEVTGGVGKATAKAKALGTDRSASENSDSAGDPAFEKYVDEHGRTHTRRVA